LTKSITSVQGVKLTNQLTPGQGTSFETVAMVELSGNATVSDLAKALEAAQTPHRAQAAPGVVALVPGKLKSGTTPAQIIDALKKAGLTAE
jgi:hypothetical protein